MKIMATFTAPIAAIHRSGTGTTLIFYTTDICIRCTIHISTNAFCKSAQKTRLSALKPHAPVHTKTAATKPCRMAITQII